MFTDVVDLDEFYRSALGQVARRTIRRQIRSVWPDVRGMAVLGLGHATPYLTPFRNEAGWSTGIESWRSHGPALGSMGTGQEPERRRDLLDALAVFEPAGLRTLAELTALPLDARQADPGS